MKFLVVMYMLFIAGGISFAQQMLSSEIVKGKIIADLSELDGIYIINISTEETSISKIGGYFSIAAKVGDTLMFSSTLTKADRIVLTREDIAADLIFVRLEMIANKLDEVIVRRYNNISAEKLGLVPRGQKRFSPAERKLNAASNPYEQIGLSSAASLDPVINWLSGRTAMLKKEAEIEKKESWLDMLANMYDVEYVTKLKIPTEYVSGFFRYCVDNLSFVNTLKTGNKTMAAFQLAELAVKYNEIIALESR